MISGFSLWRLDSEARKACSGVPPCATIRPRTRATQRPEYGDLCFSELAISSFIFPNQIRSSGGWFVLIQSTTPTNGRFR
jgi:hypothetical protein